MLNTFEDPIRNEKHKFVKFKTHCEWEKQKQQET